MQASAVILFTRDGYIIQAAVNPQLESTLPSDEFIPIARFASFLLISGESRVTNAKIRKYYAVVSSIGHIGCVVLYLYSLTTDAVQYALVQSVLLLSVVHHYSGSAISTISEYIEYFNFKQEQRITASQHYGADAAEGVLGMNATSNISSVSSPVRRFYMCQIIYTKIKKHFRHESVDYFTRLAFLTCLTPPCSARNLFCKKIIHNRELFIFNLSYCLGLVYVALPHSDSRNGCILRIVGEKLKWTLQQNTSLSSEIGYLCCLSNQLSWPSQGDSSTEASLVPSTAYLCCGYQLVIQPCQFINRAIPESDESNSDQPVCSFYLCLAALLTRESLRNVDILEHITSTSARLQLTPFETHKQLFQLATTICHPFHNETRSIKEHHGQIPTSSTAAVIPTQPPLFAKKAVFDSVPLEPAVNHEINKRTSSSELSAGSRRSRISVMGASDSSHSTSSSLQFTVRNERSKTTTTIFKTPRHH